MGASTSSTFFLESYFLQKCLGKNWKSSKGLIIVQFKRSWPVGKLVGRPVGNYERKKEKRKVNKSRPPTVSTFYVDRSTIIYHPHGAIRKFSCQEFWNIVIIGAQKAKHHGSKHCLGSRYIKILYSYSDEWMDRPTDRQTDGRTYWRIKLVQTLRVQIVSRVKIYQNTIFSFWWTEGQTDGRTDGQTYRPMDGQTDQ